MKSNLELLKIIRACRRKMNVPSVGLCSIAKWCKEEGMTTPKEHKRIMRLLKSHKPIGVPASEHWFHYNGIERGKFLNKLITKLRMK